MQLSFLRRPYADAQRAQMWRLVGRDLLVENLSGESKGKKDIQQNETYDITCEEGQYDEPRVAREWRSRFCDVLRNLDTQVRRLHVEIRHRIDDNRSQED